MLPFLGNQTKEEKKMEKRPNRVRAMAKLFMQPIIH